LGGIAAAVLVGVALGALTPQLFHAQRSVAIATVQPVGGLKAAPATVKPAAVEVAVQDKASATGRRAPKPRRVHAEPRPAVAPPVDGTLDETAKMLAGAGDPPAAQPANASCVGAACWPETALVADRRLRDAYTRAVQAGVANDALEDFRDSWVGARRRQADDPATVLERYGRLENDLLQETQKAEGRRRRDLLARVSD
jgi:hypothetical protein